MTDPATTVELELDRTWAYGADLQHGGRLLELVAGAAVSDRHPHPLATTAHFLSPPRLGPAQVHVEPLRAGRSVSTTRARLVQGGRTCLDVTVTATALSPDSEPAHVDAVPPDLPPPDACVRSGPLPGQARNGILEQLDLRAEPGAVGAWAGGPLPGPCEPRRAEVRGWVRHADGRDADALSLLCLADALPPVTFALGLPGWVPTVELTVHVRALPAPGWLRLVQRAQLLQGGWLDETCEIWDSRDRLVAQAVQLAGYRPT